MKLEPINLDQITIDDGFWNKHIDLVRNVIIPYQWDAINDRIPDAQSSHCLENFQIAAGESEGAYYGAVFQDTDIAKWLEAVGCSLCSHKDEGLERTADEAIGLIARAQQEDGYLDTYFIVKEPDRKWRDLCEGHELYTAGHMIEAAVAYYKGTGKRTLLDCVIRLADLICRTFGPGEGQLHGYPGHQEIELAMVKLYHVTGERKYLDMAKYFLDARGVSGNYFLEEMKSEKYMHLFPEFESYDVRYSQSHMPVREQNTAEGHAVRAVYMYSAMADIAWEYGDQEMLKACERLWDNIVNRRMYITGGIGSSGILERFTTDYDLPNSFNYSETCASIGMAMFGLRMANITRDGKYVDVVERELYNNILAGVALDGRSFFYVNPLEVWPPACMERTSREHVKPSRQRWFGVACCPPNVARMLASLGQYVVSSDSGSLYLNLFVSMECSVEIGGNLVKVMTETEFPWKNEVTLKLLNIPERGMRAAIRIPRYAENASIYRDGVIEDCPVEKQYALLHVEKDCELRLRFDSPARFVRSHPQVRENAGKAALVRGPLVYCLEERDNGGNLPAVMVKAGTTVEEERLDELGGITALYFDGFRIAEEEWPSDVLYQDKEIPYRKTRLKAVPYAYWNNRGTGEMLVWIRETPRL